MTGYELTDVVSDMLSNILAAQALFFTALSAYLFVAYAIGKNSAHSKQHLSVLGFCSLHFWEALRNLKLLFLTVGALIFMWSIRHPKTE